MPSGLLMVELGELRQSVFRQGPNGRRVGRQDPAETPQAQQQLDFAELLARVDQGNAPPFAGDNVDLLLERQLLHQLGGALLRHAESRADLLEARAVPPLDEEALDEVEG